MSSEPVNFSDGEDKTPEEAMEVEETDKSSPSLLDKFYDKYVLKPESSVESETKLKEKVATNLSSALNFNYFKDCTGEGGDSVPSGSNGVAKLENASNNFKQYKTDGRNNHWQQFELPNVVKADETASLPEQPVVLATRYISGVAVQLPVVPYPAQLSVMDKVIKGITHGEHCLIESPTGSGKTLALLCSSLAWQKKERERIEQLVYESRTRFDSPSKPPDGCCTSTSESDRIGSDAASISAPGTPTKRTEKFKNKKSKKAAYIDDDSDDEDAFVKKPVKKSTKCSEISTENDSCSKNCRDIKISNESEENSDKNSWKRKETSPDITGREDLVSIHKKPKLSSDVLPGTPTKQQPSGSSPSCSPSKPNLVHTEPFHIPKVPRIIFGTRTHKQIKQVIKELRRTTYSKNLQMSILSSREHSCIQHLPNTFTSKTKYCKALMDKNKHQTPKKKIGESTGSGCRYFDNKKALVGSRGPKDVWDIEDLVVMGNKRAACPYFAARDLADYAHIVFCPYNYILDPIIRSSIQLSLEGNIILVDEGHNIEDTCRDTASLSIDIKEIRECIKELEDVIKMTRFSEEDDNELFYYFKKYFQNWEDLFHNHLPLLRKQSASESSYLMEGTELADTLKRHSIGYSQFEEFKVRVNIVIAESRNTDKDDVQKRHIPTGAGTLLQSIVFIFEYFFKNACKHLDNYNGIFVKRANEWKGKSEDIFSLKISCMDPSLVFTEISSHARCVVLSSGTLTPMLSFSSELGTVFKHTLQARHVIRPDQVWVGTIDSGPDGVPLEATYKNTSSTEWQDSLGQIILWVSQKVPNGVLCFMSSYRLIEILQERWEGTGVWQKLQEIKYVYTESKNMTDHDQIMTDYYSSVNEGAILFAVFRGKVSEGMDFKDHQARAVITVGIPYANVKDPMVDGKMKYNNIHQNDRKLVSGRDWYSIQAFRALNQALGRCIRHKDDWGAIIMVDSRLRRDNMKQHISKWVQTFLAHQHHNWPSFTTGTNNLERFMNNMQSLEEADDSL